MYCTIYSTISRTKVLNIKQKLKRTSSCKRPSESVMEWYLSRGYSTSHPLSNGEIPVPPGALQAYRQWMNGFDRPRQCLDMNPYLQSLASKLLLWFLSSRERHSWQPLSVSDALSAGVPKLISCCSYLNSEKHHFTLPLLSRRIRWAKNTETNSFVWLSKVQKVKQIHFKNWSHSKKIPIPHVFFFWNCLWPFASKSASNISCS